MIVVLYLGFIFGVAAIAISLVWTGHPYLGAGIGLLMGAIQIRYKKGEEETP
jgi:hypothetical protein